MATSSPFDFDSPITYDEYVKTIFHHAESYNAPPQGRTNIVKTLNAEAEHARGQGRYDVAFYYYLKALQMFDKEKKANSARRTKEDEVLMGIALDQVDTIRSNQLRNQYNGILKRIEAAEPDRKRLLAMQREPDKNDANQADYELRRQQLLKSDGNEADKLAALFGAVPNTPVPSPKPLQSPTASLTEYRQGVRATNWSFPAPPNQVNCSRRGIVNLGNTCFMNSVLQMLNSTGLADSFCKETFESQLNKGETSSHLSSAFRFIVRELRRDDCNTAVSASPLKHIIEKLYEPFQGNSQHDANEFLRVLLDELHNGVNTNIGNRNIQLKEIDNFGGSDSDLAKAYWTQYELKNKSIVTDLCAFQERSALKCPSCGHVSRSFQPTIGIEVPISKKSKISIEDCLLDYCKEETLDSDSLYVCPSCKNKVNATKQLLLYSAPQILFITLKRFRSYGDFSNLSKVNDEVFFQLSLDITSFMTSKNTRALYSLVGIVNHMGNMHGGHYTCDARGTDSTWCHFSDETVMKADKPNFRQAYILCYVRVSP